jgi:hypothetical protein
MLTLVDAVALAYDKLESHFSDKQRLERGKSLVIDVILNKDTAYQFKRDTKQPDIWYVTKPLEGKETEPTQYTINLAKPYMRCNCPDVIDLGTIHCKHVIACSLLSSALSIRLLDKDKTIEDKKEQDVYLTVKAEVTQAQEILAEMLLDLLSGKRKEIGLIRSIKVGSKTYNISIQER